MAGGPIYKGGIPFYKPGVRFKGNAGVTTGAGAPTNGTSGTGAGKFDIGSIYLDTTNGNAYVNQGTKASPTWVCTTAAAAGMSSVVSQRQLKYAVLSLTGAAVHAAAVGMVNPEGAADVTVVGATVDITTHATAASGSIDVGWTSGSITTASATIQDGILVGSGVTVPVSYVTATPVVHWTNGTWITVSDDGTADVTGFVGKLYIAYIID
jgi:hypothetical protein